MTVGEVRGLLLLLGGVGEGLLWRIWIDDDDMTLLEMVDEGV